MTIRDPASHTLTTNSTKKVQKLMDGWHVPGLAIGLIQGSSTSFKVRHFPKSMTA
jgi:hypothetical protein